AVRRSRGPRGAETDRSGRMGGDDFQTPAPRRPMGHRRQLRARAVPPEIRRDELAPPRPLRSWSPGDSPANREGREAVPPSVWRSVRGSGRSEERGLFHGQRRPHAHAVRIPRPSIGTIVDRLAPATSEVRRWLALLPLSNGDLGWLGGLSGLRGDPGGEAFGRDASSHRTRGGVLSRTRPASRRANAVCTVDAIALPRPLLLRDRKSTRLNSSHLVISYAVFCLKKKKKKITQTH